MNRAVRVVPRWRGSRAGIDVTPAKAGVQACDREESRAEIPAFAGMTTKTALSNQSLQSTSARVAFSNCMDCEQEIAVGEPLGIRADRTSIEDYG